MSSSNVHSPAAEARLQLLQRARRYATLAEQASDPELGRAYREEAEDCLRRAGTA